MPKWKVNMENKTNKLLIWKELSFYFIFSRTFCWSKDPSCGHFVLFCLCVILLTCCVRSVVVSLVSFELKTAAAWLSWSSHWRRSFLQKDLRMDRWWRESRLTMHLVALREEELWPVLVGLGAVQEASTRPGKDSLLSAICELLLRYVATYWWISQLFL